MRADRPRRAGVATAFGHHARAHPRVPAVVDAGGAIDFAALDQAGDRLATALERAGVGRGDRVAARLPQTRHWFECLLACAKLTAVLVPVDRALAPGEVDHVLRDSGAALMLDGAEACDDAAAGAPATGHPLEAEADDPLLIMYTSGTTGRPKGAVLTHGNVLFSAFNQLVGWRLTAADRALVVAPMHHVAGLLVLGFPCLHAGGTVQIADPDPEAILATIARERISALFLPPRLWRRVAESDALDRTDLGSVRVGASGGEPIPIELLRRLIDAFGAELTDAYGLTEAASCSTLLRGDDILRRAGSAGTPCVHNLLRINGPDGLEAPAGQVGEIVQAGPTVMREYWRRPDETAAALAGGWLRTGDLGRIDEQGFLYVVGRSKDLIVSGGAKVYPAEVERTLREHPAVADAAVIGVPDAALGEAVAAVVVAREGAAITAGEVTEHCAGRLAAAKQPGIVVVRESLPRNASGKVLKGELRRSWPTVP